MKQEKLISASELGEYVYCRRSWWLKMVRHVEPNAATRAAQAEGERWHAVQGERIAASGRWRNTALALVALAIALLLMWWWGVSR